MGLCDVCKTPFERLPADLRVCSNDECFRIILKKMRQQEKKTIVDNYLVNLEIFSPIISLVDEDGKLLGQYDKNKAMSIARDKELDLVQLSDGQDDIPICKILNYDKFRYQLQKKEKNQQRSLVVKEIQFGINITDHDKQTKVNQQNVIELKNEANGLYFVKIMSDNKIIGSQKILKRQY